MKMKKIILFFIIQFFAVQLFAQTAILQPAPPEKVGMSSVRMKQIDKHLQNYIDKQWVAGTVAIVARNGKVVHYNSLGYSNIANKTAMKKDDMFHIMSMTKPIVSLAVMMLYEENRLMLDEPVSNYIPEFKNLQVLDSVNMKDSSFSATPTRKPLTIRHLLSHTSGIGYGFIHANVRAIYAKAGIPDGASGSKTKMGEKMKILASMPLMHQPGERWTYGLNTDMLGYLVEVISGQSLAEFVEQRILKPLTMNDTHFGLPKEKESRLASVYYENEKGTLGQYRKIDADLLIEGGRTYFSGGSGLVSTAMDYLKFAQMLLNGGELNGVRLVSRKTIDIMITNQIGGLFINSTGDKFGLGFSVAEASGYKGIGAANTYGWGGAFTTNFWFDKKEGIAAVLMTQVAPTSHGDIVDKFKIAVYQALND